MGGAKCQNRTSFSLASCFEILSAHWIGMGCILGGKIAQQIEPKAWETHGYAFAVAWASSDLGLAYKSESGYRYLLMSCVQGVSRFCSQALSFQSVERCYSN